MTQFMNMENNIRIPPEQKPPEQNLLLRDKIFSTEFDSPSEKFGIKNKFATGQTKDKGKSFSVAYGEDSFAAFAAVIATIATIAAIDYAIQIKRAAIRAEVSGFKNLPDDWDGDDGHAPDLKDIENAISFFTSHIPDSAVDIVRTIVAGDGEVGFEWREAKCYLEISFSEGEISFFGDMPDGGGRLKGDAVYGEKSIPKKLQDLILTIFPK